MTDTRRKVFQIGFNRCGTRAIATFFEEHGYRAAHWEFGQLARDLEADLAAGRVPLSGWSQVDVFTDIELVTEAELIEGFRQYKALHEAYPEALFVLNTRSVEAWLRSRLQHAEGLYVTAYQAHLGLANRQKVLDAWRRDWFAHHLEVLDFFSGRRRENLYLWDLPRPNFRALSGKLGHEVRPEAWGKVGGKREDTRLQSLL